MVKKPASTLPIRKHKFATTPSTGQAITKFFDKKEEQARLQQQLAKPRPAPPPPTFSDQTAVPRAQAASAAQAPARTAAPATAAASHGQPAVVHVTSAAGPQAQHHLANAEAQLPPAKHQVQLQQQQPAPSLAASDGIPVQKAASPYTCPVSNVKGGYNARQKGSGQASLDFMMSQDDDGCCIKWQASPQHQALTPSQAGPASGSLPNQDVTAMKQRLANAVQRSAGSSAESSRRSQSSETRDTLLDDLLALPPPQHSRLQKVTNLDRLSAKVLSPSSRSNCMAKSGTNGPGSAIKTPRGLAGVSSGGPRKRVSFGMDPESGMCATPGSAKSGSVFKKKSRRQQGSENSGTGGKRSGDQKRKAIIDLIEQVEMLVQSRNVRERLGSDQALQNIPDAPSQEALLSQQEQMLHEIQNSQEAARHRLAPSGPQEANETDGPVQGSEHSQGKMPTDMACSPDALPLANADVKDVVAEGLRPPEHGLRSNAGPQQTEVQAECGEDLSSQQTATAQAVSNQKQRCDLRVNESSSNHTKSSAHLQCHAGSTAAMDYVNSSSGVLAQDFLDELDPKTTEQLAEVERAAQLTLMTQRTQQAQHAQRSQQAQHAQHATSGQAQQPQKSQHDIALLGGNAVAADLGQAVAEVVLPYIAESKRLPALTAAALQGKEQDAVALQRSTQHQGRMKQAHPGPNPGAQHGTQHSVLDFDDSFPDSCDFDDALAQLLDSAAAPRPGGSPHVATAGPRPDSCSSSPGGPRSTSAGSRSNSAGSRPNSVSSGQTPETSPNANGGDVRACSLPKGNRAYSQTALAMATNRQGVMHEAQLTSCTRRDDEGVLALEPAGPVEQEPEMALPHLAGHRTSVHYQVKDVQQTAHEKLLILEGTYSKEHVVVHLHNGWVDTPVEPGHSVNLLAHKAPEGDGVLHAVCDFDTGMVILHPDLLLSGTRVSGSFRCKRQAVLEERFAGSSNDKAVEGTLMHEVFQVALTKRITNRARLEEVARSVIADATDKLLEVGLDEHRAMARLQQAIPSMLSWVQRFLRPQPAQNATVEVGVGEGVGGGVKLPMCVRQVVDIEENVWAPKYGLKGMIDASLSTSFQIQGGAPRHKGWMQNASQPQQAQTAGDVMVPLEFKTGKPHVSHRAQVSLYLLLMQERYGQVIESGLLWYLGSLSPHQVRLVPAELQALIMHRNILAGHLMPGKPLPEVIRDDWACGKCFQKAACAISHKALEQGSEESSGLGESYTELTGHIPDASAQFFQHWLRLVELEEAPLQSKRAEIWTMPGQQREKAGRCIADLVLDPTAGNSPTAKSHEKPLLGLVAKHKLQYTFMRVPHQHKASQQALGKDALNEKGFTEGDMVVLSIQGEQACVCRPTVLSISSQSVTLAVDKPLKGSMLVSQVRWRIDKDEVSSIFTRMRCNLLDFMDPALETVRQARRLIADLEAPAQPCQADAIPPREPGSPLNEDQHAAVTRVLSTPDYALILGMPGTGKTSTIVQAIKGLVAQGKSVLLSSYTNSAVDNVLLKLLQEGVQFLRLGRRESVHPLLQHWTVGGEQYPDTSVKALKLLSETAQVMACTALGVNNCLLKGRIFDMCIVDEAGQMTLPVALGPILHSKGFTLVGDHFQLPPLVTSRAAEEGGLGVSLFKRLCEAHPQTVVELKAQYRMAADIMLLANTIVYDGRLRCGTDNIAEAVLDLQVMPSQLSQPDWLVQVLAPHRRVLFLDTDSMPAPEVRAGDALSNPREAAIVIDIVKALDLGRVSLDGIGIISPYRAQVLLLQRLCKHMAWSNLEVLTVDKCQGRDKDVVLLSLVRSNDENNAGNLLRDWRRLNVAITRAKKKLILIGSQKTLRTIAHFSQLLKLMSQRQWSLSLPCLD